MYHQYQILSWNGSNKIENVPVSGYAERDRVFDTKTSINRLSSPYSGELLRRCFDIIGSLKISGNIVGSTNSVSFDLNLEMVQNQVK